jgi:hypothetical protein
VIPFVITEGMSQNFGPRALIVKKCDIVGRDHSNIAALCWKDERKVHHTHLQLRGDLV